MYGFPRAGNTLLGCILNQNPRINATANSVLPEIMFSINKIKFYDTAYNNFPDESSIDNILKNLFNSYYQDWSGDFIIERGGWITPGNFSLLEKYFQDEIKIVVLVRDILDVIKSYLNLSFKDPNFYINLQYNELDPTTLYKSEVEEKCDLIMQRGDIVDKMLYSIKWLLDNKKQDFIHFVEYEDFMKNPKKEIKKIYKFFNIDYYNHWFTNLNQFSVNGIEYNDGVPGTAMDMHTIRTEKIGDVPYSIELPQSVINKYSGLELWR